MKQVRKFTALSFKDRRNRADIYCNNMASVILSEDHFLCSICLDVFTDPVTIPCGHNFCKSCIKKHWLMNVRCPLCQKRFEKKPELCVNTCISQMVVLLKQSTVRKIPSRPKVLCDVCTEARLKALKSCLVCLASYCETHLELHHKLPGLRRHQLVDPLENLELRMNKKYQRPLLRYYKRG